jgi:hypothetical protein
MIALVRQVHTSVHLVIIVIAFVDHAFSLIDCPLDFASGILFVRFNGQTEEHPI